MHTRDSPSGGDKVDAIYIKGMLSNPDIQPNIAINRWIAAILLFNFKLVHIPANKRRGPNGLSRRAPAPSKEEDNDPEDWVDNTLSLGIWVVSWLDAFPTDTSHAANLTLSLITNNNDNDNANIDAGSAQTRHPHCDCRLPAQYRTGEYVLTDTSSTHLCLRPLDSDAPRPPSMPTIDEEDTNTHNADNAIQCLGTHVIRGGREQLQATANPSAPTSRWGDQDVVRSIGDEGDGDGKEGSNADADSATSVPLYTDIGKHARTNNNNNNSLPSRAP